MSNWRSDCPELPIEPPENKDQDIINQLAYMSQELISIKTFCEDSENFSDILMDAYYECFERYRRMANGKWLKWKA